MHEVQGCMCRRAKLQNSTYCLLLLEESQAGGHQRVKGEQKLRNCVKSAVYDDRDQLVQILIV